MGWRSDSTGKIEVEPMTHAPPNAASDFGRRDKSCYDRMNTEAELEVFVEWGHELSLRVRKKRLEEILEKADKHLSEDQRRDIDSLMWDVMLRPMPVGMRKFQEEDVKKLLEILKMTKGELYRRCVESLL